MAASSRASCVTRSSTSKIASEFGESSVGVVETVSECGVDHACHSLMASQTVNYR
jgi:hypothetical protein